MIAIRYTVASMLAFTLTGGLFWLLWSLVSATVDVGDFVEAARIEFTRMRRDTEVVTKRDERVEREPPPAMPVVPPMAFSQGAVDNNIQMQPPRINARGAMLGINLTAGSDRDVLPLVRINPDYPQRALAREIEGWVLVQFTITAIGSVKDAVVIDANPKGVFDDAVLKAIARWRYNPRIVDGTPVERVGVRTVITFELDEEG